MANTPVTLSPTQDEAHIRRRILEANALVDWHVSRLFEFGGAGDDSSSNNSVDAEQAPAANPDQLSYEETLERWALYDYSAFENPRRDDEMRDLFQRWRATRSKPVTVGGTVTPRSLDRAWTAFVERWNTETGAKFVRMLERREATHEHLSLGALARRVCELSWEADRMCCFVHHWEGCASCHGYGVPRPDTREWERIRAEPPLSDTEREVISRYEQALQASSRVQGARRGAPPRRVENLPPTRGLPHTPPRSPERRPQAPHGAPSYQAWDPASTRYIHDGEERRRRGDGRHDPVVEQREYRRVEGSIPRYIARYQRDPREEPGRHAGMVDQGRREEAATAQLLDRLAQPLHRVEHENAELRRRVWQQEGAARREPPREDPRNAGAWHQRH
ncbi:hypothetical protein PC121_g8718 [Phytophthora cactorum]|nr:hypothetical protein PC120_g6040 [Phytophthora cactorum]KAG3073310.1 hypothetical protein PC121_g8718 [Phytophthora cactorum]